MVGVSVALIGRSRCRCRGPARRSPVGDPAELGEIGMRPARRRSAGRSPGSPGPASRDSRRAQVVDARARERDRAVQRAACRCARAALRPALWRRRRRRGGCAAGGRPAVGAVDGVAGVVCVGAARRAGSARRAAPPARSDRCAACSQEFEAEHDDDRQHDRQIIMFFSSICWSADRSSQRRSASINAVAASMRDAGGSGRHRVPALAAPTDGTEQPPQRQPGAEERPVQMIASRAYSEQLGMITAARPDQRRNVH